VVPDCHQRPDYSGGGFLNLVASLTAARGGKPRHATLAALPPEALSKARNLVFLIVDGLGDNYLRANGGRGALLAARQGSISAVFPSTTASAITTSFTGCSPLEHGLTGWFTYYGEANCVAAALPFQPRGSATSLAERGVASSRLFRHGSLFDGLGDRSIVVSWDRIIDSTYNAHHCGGAERLPYAKIDGLVAGIETAVKSGDDRKFIYAYWWQFDALCHHFGVGSPEALAHFTKVDAALAGLLARLAGTDTLVVATADHGFMDSTGDAVLSLDDAPELAPLLRLPLCGERRVAFCHVQPGRTSEFAEKAKAWLGERADVLPSRQLADEGWFGPGSPHPDFAERIGDVTILLRDRNTLKDWVYGEAQFLHIGNHGGTSADELRIPLVVAHT
jgi:hypothetical protein